MSNPIILGAKRSKGTLDNGNTYDSTKIYVQTAMKPSPDQVGFSVSEFNWGDSSNYDKIKHVKFPAEANITYEMVTKGKSNQVIVTDVQILKPTPKV